MGKYVYFEPFNAESKIVIGDAEHKAGETFETTKEVAEAYGLIPASEFKEVAKARDEAAHAVADMQSADNPQGEPAASK